MSVMSKWQVLYRIFLGYCIKWKIDINGHKKLNKLPTNARERITVSLTSYGRRVSDNIVYYTLVSLINQTRQPNRIVLWLDSDNWSDEKIPHKIVSLRKFGVEIHYCDDIKSYKKLLPSLILYPNDVIITVDDDVYYRKDLIEELYSFHKKENNSILSFNASRPSLDSNGSIKTYTKWENLEKYEIGLDVVSVGVNGVLYPPHCFHEDVFDKNVFMELCPCADDIWFWIMALRNGTKHVNIKVKHNMLYSFDALYQFFHKGSALTHSNRFKHQNDVQLEKILQHYNIKDEVVKILNDRESVL